MALVGASPIENMTVTDSIMATEAVRISANIRQAEQRHRRAAGRGDAADFGRKLDAVQLTRATPVRVRLPAGATDGDAAASSPGRAATARAAGA